ncbi:MAG: tol-pal system protein YbgF [Magnetococcales bacterium]|nr:tol-pal system protein YbgF [Magnetococcales bacterium]
MMGRNSRSLDSFDSSTVAPNKRMPPLAGGWIPALLLIVLPLSACVSGSSSNNAAYDEGDHRPPVRTEAGPPPPPVKRPLPEVVDTLANRLEKNEDFSRTVSTSMERRLGLMEKEITSLRGEVDELQHAKSKLESELEAKNRLMAQQASQLTQSPQATPVTSSHPDDPDYDPAQQDTLQTATLATGADGIASTRPAAAGTQPGTATMTAKAASSINQSGKKNAVTAPAVAKHKPATAKQAYDDAFQLLKSGRYEDSLTAFKNYMEWFPNDALSDNAQYWIGELYYVQRKFPDALMAFNQVLVRWPTSGKVPASLLKIGFAFYELNDMDNAKNSLTRLVSDYPESPAVSMAKQRLEMIDGKLSKH